MGGREERLDGIVPAVVGDVAAVQHLRAELGHDLVDPRKQFFDRVRRLQKKLWRVRRHVLHHVLSRIACGGEAVRRLRERTLAP